MILLVDAGNSYLKWRVTRAGQTLASGRLATASVGAGGERELAEAWRPWPLTGVCICNVAGEPVTGALHALLDERGDAPTPRVVHPVQPRTRAHGLENRYQPPQALGADRYAALVAARQRQGPGAGPDWVVVNVGTAMTADMLTAEGVFLGGVILPGPDLMGAALAGGTAGIGPGRAGLNLPLDLSRPPDATARAVAQGVAWGLWGGVMGMVWTLGRTTGREVGVLVSGGGRAVLGQMRENVAAHAPGTLPAMAPWVEVDELVLEGVAWIARDLGLDA